MAVEEQVLARSARSEHVWRQTRYFRVAQTRSSQQEGMGEEDACTWSSADATPLSERDTRIVLSLLESPPKPSSRLTEAARKYRDRFGI